MLRPFAAYAVALAALAGAVGARWVLDPALGNALPLTITYMAITVAVWLAGWQAAILVTILGYGLGSYLFIEPRGSITLDEPAKVVALVAYLVISGIIIGLGEAIRASRRRALRTEEELRLALDASRVIAWTYDFRANRVGTSANARSIVGIPGSMSSTEAIQIIHPDDVQTLVHTVQQAIDHRQEFVHDFRLNRPDNGQAVWLQSRGKIEADSRGQPLRILGTAADITERKRAEQSLDRRVREQGALCQLTDRLHRADSVSAIYRAALDAILDALGCDRASILLLDERDVMQFVAWSGLSDPYRQAVSGHTPWKRSDKDARPIGVGDVAQADLPGPLRKVIENEGIGALAFVPLVEDDELIGKFMIYFNAPHAFTEQEMELALTIARQLSFAIRRSRAEQALRRSEERYRAVVDHQTEMLCRFRMDGTILFVNPAYARSRGTTPQFLLGGNFWDFIPEDERPAVRALLDRLTPESPEVRIENRFETTDGGRWTLWTNRALSFDEHGKVAEAQSTGIDITERKKAEEALREADRRKDEFLATLAHELRNPLAPLLNSLELIKQSRAEPHLTVAATDTMHRQLNHMVRLIDDLLDVSRITQNKLELKMQPVELAAVIDQAVEAVRPVCQQSGHVLNVSLPTEPIHLDADPVRLAQVLGNLLSNACKYTPAGGRISLTACRQDGELVISVQDNGVGIPSEMLSRVFDLFMQVDRPIEREQGGLGIGLSLVKQLVEMHRGSVVARSEGENRGSEFVIRLPLTLQKPEAREPSASAGPAGAGRRQRILVVDDNRDAALGLSRLLQFNGHQTEIAHDGVEAVERAALFDPSVVLLDVGLPRMSGIDACRAIRRQPRGPQRLIIALTGWGQDEDRRRTTEAGFDAHLVKPVSIGMLLSLVDQHEVPADFTPAAAS